jgi:hypothetical protein
LARLVEYAREGLFREIGTEDIEGGFDLRIKERLLQGGTKCFGRAGVATKRFRKRPDKSGVPLAGLYFDTDKSPGKRSRPMRGAGYFLGRSHREFSCN